MAGQNGIGGGSFADVENNQAQTGRSGKNDFSTTSLSNAGIFGIASACGQPSLLRLVGSIGETKKPTLASGLFFTLLFILGESALSETSKCEQNYIIYASAFISAGQLS